MRCSGGRLLACACGCATSCVLRCSLQLLWWRLLESIHSKPFAALLRCAHACWAGCAVAAVWARMRGVACGMSGVDFYLRHSTTCHAVCRTPPESKAHHAVLLRTPLWHVTAAPAAGCLFLARRSANSTCTQHARAHAARLHASASAALTCPLPWPAPAPHAQSAAARRRPTPTACWRLTWAPSTGDGSGSAPAACCAPLHARVLCVAVSAGASRSHVHLHARACRALPRAAAPNAPNAPRRRNFPRLNMAKSIGQGVTFLNR